LGDRFEVLDVRNSELSKADQALNDCKQYCIKVKDLHSNEELSIPLTQAGLKFKNAILEPQEIARGNELYELHQAQARQLHPSKNSPTDATDGCIVSYAGIGRNAALICYREISERIKNELIGSEAALDQALTDVIKQGRESRGPKFLHSAAQLEALKAALLIQMHQQPASPSAAYARPFDTGVKRISEEVAQFDGIGKKDSIKAQWQRFENEPGAVRFSELIHKFKTDLDNGNSACVLCKEQITAWLSQMNKDESLRTSMFNAAVESSNQGWINTTPSVDLIYQLFGAYQNYVLDQTKKKLTPTSELIELAQQSFRFQQISETAKQTQAIHPKSPIADIELYYLVNLNKFISVGLMCNPVQTFNNISDTEENFALIANRIRSEETAYLISFTESLRGPLSKAQRMAFEHARYRPYITMDDDELQKANLDPDMVTKLKNITECIQDMSAPCKADAKADRYGFRASLCEDVMIRTQSPSKPGEDQKIIKYTGKNKQLKAIAEHAGPLSTVGVELAVAMMFKD